MSFQTGAVLDAPCLDSIFSLHISPFLRTRLSSRVSPSWVSDTRLCCTSVSNTILCWTAVLFCLNLYRVSPSRQTVSCHGKNVFLQEYIFAQLNSFIICVFVIGHIFNYLFVHRPKSINYYFSLDSLIARIWLLLWIPNS